MRIAILALTAALLAGCANGPGLSDEQRSELASKMLMAQYQHNLDLQH
jgi:hypothetical protein